MAAALHVYKEVKIRNEGLLRGQIRRPGTVTVSYDEKPGVQANGAANARPAAPAWAACLPDTGLEYRGAYSARFPPVA
jgi:hypothetical protein